MNFKDLRLKNLELGAKILWRHVGLSVLSGRSTSQFQENAAWTNLFKSLMDRKSTSCVCKPKRSYMTSCVGSRGMGKLYIFGRIV
jgi:hypothetical protein